MYLYTYYLGTSIESIPQTAHNQPFHHHKAYGLQSCFLSTSGKPITRDLQEMRQQDTQSYSRSQEDILTS